MAAAIRLNEQHSCCMAAAIRLNEQHSCSFDYLVGAGEQRGRNVEAERPCGLDIDEEVVLGGRLHRKVSRLLALEDAIDVAGRATVRVNGIRSIGEGIG